MAAERMAQATKQPQFYSRLLICQIAREHYNTQPPGVHCCRLRLGQADLCDRE